MNKLKIATLGFCFLTIFSCATKQGTGALIGTGGGAVLGAIIGRIAGNTAVGAAIGGAVGAGDGSGMQRLIVANVDTSGVTGNAILDKRYNTGNKLIPQRWYDRR